MGAEDTDNGVSPSTIIAIGRLSLFSPDCPNINLIQSHFYFSQILRRGGVLFVLPRFSELLHVYWSVH